VFSVLTLTYQGIVLGLPEVRKLTETLDSLSKGLYQVNSTIEKQHSLLTHRLDALERNSPGFGGPSRSSSGRRAGTTPYRTDKRGGPFRRSKKQKTFLVSILSLLASCPAPI
jgi:hypothetical protein